MKTVLEDLVTHIEEGNSPLEKMNDYIATLPDRFFLVKSNNKLQWLKAQ